MSKSNKSTSNLLKPLAARIKKLMQSSEDVGKIAQATPFLVARAMEVFAERLSSGSAAVAAQRDAKTVTRSHLKACIDQTDEFDFLREAVNIPDEPAVPESRSSGRGRGIRASRGSGRGADLEPKLEDGAALPVSPEGGRGRGRGSKRKSSGLEAAAGPSSIKQEDAPAPGAANADVVSPSRPIGLTEAYIPASAFESKDSRHQPKKLCLEAAANGPPAQIAQPKAEPPGAVHTLLPHAAAASTMSSITGLAQPDTHATAAAAPSQAALQAPSATQPSVSLGDIAANVHQPASAATDDKVGDGKATEVNLPQPIGQFHAQYPFSALAKPGMLPEEDDYDADD